MRNFAIAAVATVFLVGCPHNHVGDQNDAWVQLDAEPEPDAELLADAEVQNDAAVQHDSAIHDASIQDAAIEDAAIHDASIQEDASIGEDADITDAGIDAGGSQDAAVQTPEVAYYTESLTQYSRALWDGVAGVAGRVIVYAVNMDSDLTRVKWSFINIDNNNVADASMLMDGTPLAQQNSVWLTPTELEFTVNIPLVQGDPHLLDLSVQTHDVPCAQTMAVDIAQDTDLGGQAGASNPTVFIEQPWSQTPQPLHVNNVWILLGPYNPSNLVPSNNTTLMVYEIITSFDITISASLMYITIIPISEYTHFVEVRHREYMGSLIDTLPIVTCVGNTCDLDYQNNFTVLGNCQSNLFEVEAEINGPLNDPTVTYITIDLAEWLIIDNFSGAIMPPEYQAGSLQGPILVYP